jgi:hypothetical protein
MILTGTILGMVRFRQFLEFAKKSDPLFVLLLRHVI